MARKGILIIGGVVVAGLTYGAYKLTPAVKRAWSEKAAPQVAALRTHLRGGEEDRDADGPAATD